MRLALLLSLMLVSCSSDEGACFSCIRASMGVAPYDLTTGAPEVRVRIDTSWYSDSEMDLVTIERDLRLVEWPEGTPVPSTIARGDRFTDPGVVTLTPNAPLEARWYAVRLDIRQLGLRYTTVGMSEDPDFRTTGRIEHRFHPSHHPLLVLALTGTNGYDYSLLHVGATEPLGPIVFGTDVTTLVSAARADGTAIDCAPLEGLDANMYLEIYGYFEMRCTGVDRTQPITVHVAPGLRSVTGLHPLRDATGATDMRVTWTPAESAQAPLPPTFFTLAAP